MFWRMEATSKAGADAAAVGAAAFAGCCAAPCKAVRKTADVRKLAA
jgi:hypothetical protein